MDPDRAAEDIKEAGQRGAGGVEILGYYLYNSAPGDYVPVDWTTYGWGTPAWSKYDCKTDDYSDAQFYIRATL